MQTRVLREAGVVRLMLLGRFDTSGADVFAQAFDEAMAAVDDAHPRLVVDLRELVYLDSYALRTLLIFRQRWLSAGLRPELASPGEGVRQVLHVARFDKLFLIAGDPPG